MARDDDFLATYYQTLQEDMRWRRDSEHRLFRFQIGLVAALITAYLGIQTATTGAGSSRAILAGSFAFLILAFGVFSGIKIQSEHRVYAELGDLSKKVWDHFDLFEPGAYLPEEKTVLEEKHRRYGHGKGVRETLWLLGIITAVGTGIFLWFVCVDVF